jgi:hypothetical protein
MHSRALEAFCRLSGRLLDRSVGGLLGCPDIPSPPAPLARGTARDAAGFPGLGCARSSLRRRLLTWGSGAHGRW